MKVATGEIEGWVFGETQYGPYPSYASPDNRWVSGIESGLVYLADRKSGAVYRWENGAARLLAARGDVLLFADQKRFWLATGNLERFLELPIPMAHQTHAQISPDGKAVVLLANPKLYLIDVPNGKARDIGQVNPPEMADRFPSLTLKAQGLEVVATSTFRTGGADSPISYRVQRYSWDGTRLGELVTPGNVTLSPDGKLALWRDQILGLADTLVLGSASLQPRLRVVGTSTCSLPFEGPYWLRDSSGVVVGTTRGPRLLRVDGTLEPLPLADTPSIVGIPVPAPDRDGVFAVGGMAVVDRSAKALAVAVHHSDGQWHGPWNLEPWGDTSEEMRFVLKSGGKGLSCSISVFPPTVERAPFQTYAGLQVKVAANDCVNLRREASREAAVVACLANGTQLTPADPPWWSNKGELRTLGNPAELSMGGDNWWHVRTEQGQRGWVYLSAEYLTWAQARSGEQPRDPVLTRLQDEAENLRAWLRVAAGETTCTFGCSGNSPRWAGRRTPKPSGSRRPKNCCNWPSKGGCRRDHPRRHLPAVVP